MKASELRSLSELELNNRLNESHQELFNLRFQRASGQLTKTARLREVRRTIARIKTLFRQRELTNGAA